MIAMPDTECAGLSCHVFRRCTVPDTHAVLASVYNRLLITMPSCDKHTHTGIMFPFLAQFYPGNVIPAAGRSKEETWAAVKDKVLYAWLRVGEGALTKGQSIICLCTCVCVLPDSSPPPNGQIDHTHKRRHISPHTLPQNTHLSTNTHTHTCTYIRTSSCGRGCAPQGNIHLARRESLPFFPRLCRVSSR